MKNTYASRFILDSHWKFDLQSGGGIHEFSDSQFGKYYPQ